MPVERGTLAGEQRRRRADRRGRADPARDRRQLGSIYLGGFSFADLARASRLEELEPGAVERADALFRTDAEPWCAEIF